MAAFGPCPDFVKTYSWEIMLGEEEKTKREIDDKAEAMPFELHIDLTEAGFDDDFVLDCPAICVLRGSLYELIKNSWDALLSQGRKTENDEYVPYVLGDVITLEFTISIKQHNDEEDEEEEEEEVVATYTDNGPGFHDDYLSEGLNTSKDKITLDYALGGCGRGMDQMKENAQKLNATTERNNSPHGGAEIRIRSPFSPDIYQRLATITDRLNSTECLISPSAQTHAQAFPVASDSADTDAKTETGLKRPGFRLGGLSISTVEVAKAVRITKSPQLSAQSTRFKG